MNAYFLVMNSKSYSSIKCDEEIGFLAKTCRERIVQAFKDEAEDYLLVADTLGVNRPRREESSLDTLEKGVLEKDHTAAKTTC